MTNEGGWDKGGGKQAWWPAKAPFARGAEDVPSPKFLDRFANKSHPSRVVRIFPCENQGRWYWLKPEWIGVPPQKAVQLSREKVRLLDRWSLDSIPTKAGIPSHALLVVSNVEAMAETVLKSQVKNRKAKGIRTRAEGRQESKWCLGLVNAW